MINHIDPHKVEIKFYVSEIIVKKISMYGERGKTIVEELELREDFKTGKGIWYPTYFNIHDKFNYARSEFIGRVCVAASEHGNSNDLEENIFTHRSSR